MATFSATKQLANQLGLLKRSSSGLPPLSTHVDNKGKKMKTSQQIFKYLIVLDFESTCWKDKENAYSPEVIEFPAVLLNLETNSIEDKFHQYVQPTEHKALSSFCTELTGITQEKVDNGIPIGICLKLFSNWVNKHMLEKEFSFPSSKEESKKSKAIFVTWSDWDLNTCLQYECKRKQINYSSYLKSWIDLRKTYRSFYMCKPQGLNGALKNLGILFQGREHSGIDDAINTAYLVKRMVADGCTMKATKSLILSLDVCNRYESSPILVAHKLSKNITEVSHIKELECKSHQDLSSATTSVLPKGSYSNSTKISLNVNIDKSSKTPDSRPPVGLTITPPLCHCGKRCKRKKVVNPGPNTGRVFYSCPTKRYGGTTFEDCNYFQWENRLRKTNLSEKQMMPGSVVSTRDADLKMQCKKFFNFKS